MIPGGERLGSAGNTTHVAVEENELTRSQHERALRRLLESQQTQLIPFVEELIQNEWRDELASLVVTDSGLLRPPPNRELVLGFARRALLQAVLHTRHVLQAARARAAPRAATPPPSTDRTCSQPSASTPPPPSDRFSTPLEFVSRTPGAGSAEVARRAVQQRFRPQHLHLTQASRLRRSVLLLGNGWPSCNSRHASQLDVGGIGMDQLSNRIASHQAIWAHVGQLMLLLDSAWFLPSSQLTHEQRRQSLNNLIVVLRDRSPDCQVYLCEPVPLTATVQLIENMNVFVEYARSRAEVDSMFTSVPMNDIVQPFRSRTRPNEPHYLRRRAAEKVVQEVCRRLDGMASRLPRRALHSEMSPALNTSSSACSVPSPWPSVPTHMDVDKLCEDSFQLTPRKESFA